MVEIKESLRIFMNPPRERPKANATVDEHMQFVSESRRWEERYALAKAKEDCESPIEEIVYVLLWYDSHAGHIYNFTTQYQIGKYRVDFMVEMEERKLVIECDGHEFHEKTKEQAARDKKRDRFLTAEGYTVLRFTGSEINSNAYQVLTDIKDVVYGEMVRRDLGWDF